MGRLSRIENTINSPLTDTHQIKVVPRGLPYFIDNLLRGDIRFAFRTGNSTAVINPDNTFRFGEATDVGSPSIPLTRPSKWIDIDSIVSVGLGKELRVVRDVVDNVILLDENLRFSYEAEDFVLLHSSPIKMLNAANKGDTQIQVKTKYRLGNGDIFVYKLSEGLLNSITEIRAETVSFGGTSVDPVLDKVYIMNLEEPIQRDLAADELVYIRAFPGYFSTSVRIPNPVNSSDQMGPVLVDNLSGRLTEGKNFRETLSIKTIDRRGNFILGDDNNYDIISKNHLLLNRPIRSHAFVFFETAVGEVKFTPSRVVFTSNTPQFRIGQKLVPKFPADGTTYKFNTTSTVEATMRIFFHPYDDNPIVLNIKPIPQSHTVSLPVGVEDIGLMEITIQSLSNDVSVQMSDWTTDATVNQIEYSFIAEAEGFAAYQSTGLLVKPFFLSTDLLQGTYDSGDTYNSGFIYF